jgi:hypothetical protein
MVCVHCVHCVCTGLHELRVGLEARSTPSSIPLQLSCLALFRKVVRGARPCHDATLNEAAHVGTSKATLGKKGGTSSASGPSTVIGCCARPTASHMSTENCTDSLAARWLRIRGARRASRLAEVSKLRIYGTVLNRLRTVQLPAPEQQHEEEPYSSAARCQSGGAGERRSRKSRKRIGRSARRNLHHCPASQANLD